STHTLTNSHVSSNSGIVFQALTLRCAAIFSTIIIIIIIILQVHVSFETFYWSVVCISDRPGPALFKIFLTGTGLACDPIRSGPVRCASERLYCAIEPVQESFCFFCTGSCILGISLFPGLSRIFFLC
ncbi:unnamed protein product, partial [Choristocarpus tenellus]